MSVGSAMSPGERVEDLCRSCHIEREHIVVATGDETRPARVRCSYCGSEHNYRGARQRVDERALSGAPSPEARLPGPIPDEHRELADVIRQVMREELGHTDVEITTRFRGGQLVIQPGTAGSQEKTLPLDSFFSKVIRVRNQLRVLEQHINSSEELSDESKVKFQSYITACYGSLTSFNFLFREEDDRFVGQKGA